MTERESMEYDVVIVGAGPSGLSAACKLKQLNSSLSVCVVEKGSEVGAHILSGAVIETKALTELFPNWSNMDCPVTTPVSIDQVLWLHSKTRSHVVPSFMVPKSLHNSNNYIVSLGNLCRWLAEQAELLEVDIFPGFSASDVLFDENNQVIGIATGDMGLNSQGEAKDSFTQGMALLGKCTIFAEGCRGHLGKQLIQHYRLDKACDPQHYALGFKELWRVDPEHHQEGLVIHTSGWPLSESNTGGGGYLYHLDNHQIAIGLVCDLSYKNPYFSPFDEFQRFKHHSEIAKYLKNGERISYGARTISKGGLQSQPTLHFPGGVLVGDNAGTLNNAKIKGTHTAMKSGMLAAESIVHLLSKNEAPSDFSLFQENYQSSWAYKELHQGRNVGPALKKWGNLVGGAYSFIDLNLFNGKLPWTLNNPHADFEVLEKADSANKINYPKPDGVLSFDKLSSVFLSNTNHEEDQPCHLMLKDSSIPIDKNLPLYAEPAQRYCPAGVYEIIDDGSQPKFQINAQNCIHCKACDIKDPSQNIVWVTPEGGGGPNYPNM